MSIDYTRALEKIVPKADGEDVLRLRTATVVAVNADGTVDISLSGVTVEDVPVIGSSLSLAVSSVVQVITYRGALLVLGEAASASSGSVVEFLDDELLTSSSSTWTSTESSAVMSITVPTVIGHRYRIDLTCHVSTDTQTFPITSANLEMAIVRIREDSAVGTQASGEQLALGHTSGNGFKLTTWALYTADATENKTFVVTGQRNGTGSSGNQRLIAGATRPCILSVSRVR